MRHREEFKRRIISFQRLLLVLQLVVMVMGGLIFILSVVCRPVVRIIKPDYILTVKWILDVMVGAGLMQILAASYDILSGCWKLMWPIYIGIAGTALTVFLELTAIGSSLYLYTSSLSMVNEGLVSPWYWAECLRFTSCHDRMLGYIHWYILPQVVLAVVTVILQSITILILGKLVKTISERFQVLREKQEEYRDVFEEKKFREQWKGEHTPPGGDNNNKTVQSLAPDSTNDIPRTPKKVQFTDDTEGFSSTRKRATASESNKGATLHVVHTTTYEAQIHPVVEVTTPCSIVTEDHGYIAGSRVSLDIDKL